MRKVVHIIPGLKVGGAEMMLYRLIQNFKKSDDIYQHVVIGLTPGGGMEERFRSAKIPLYVLNLKAHPLSSFLALLRLLKTERPDVVQTWMYHADLLGGIAARLSGIRNVIWGIRTTNVGVGGKLSIVVIRKLCAWLSKFVPRIIVCAAYASLKAHLTVGYEHSKMKVITNGFSFDASDNIVAEAEAIRLANDISRDTIVVGTLGRYARVKNHKLFIEVAGKLAPRFLSLKFMLVGRDLDEENTELLQLIEATGHKERFILLGEQKDVLPFYASMDIFCLHSLTEGFPNALGEAMSLKLPCVATDVGDAAFLLGETGIVVPNQDAISLERGLEKLIADSELRLLLGRKAYDRVSTSFSMLHVQSQFKQTYDDLIV